MVRPFSASSFCRMNKIANVENIVCSASTKAAHGELFHYTRAAGFEGIIRSQTLWASHYRDVTDPDEITLMRERLPQAVAPQFEAIVADLNRHQRRLFQKAGGALSVAQNLSNFYYGATFDGRARYSALEAFTCSFSTHAMDDDFAREHEIRSQWDEYSTGGGFCVVLTPPRWRRCSAKKWIRAIGRAWPVDPVRYADQAVENLFPELVAAAADTLRQFLSGVKTPEMAVPEFLAGTTLLKGVRFKPEREVRIVAIPGTAALAKHAARRIPERV